jgi:hypothetical protein
MPKRAEDAWRVVREVGDRRMEERMDKPENGTLNREIHKTREKCTGYKWRVVPPFAGQNSRGNSLIFRVFRVFRGFLCFFQDKRFISLFSMAPAVRDTRGFEIKTSDA